MTIIQFVLLVRFGHYAVPNEQLTVEPLASKFLFQPSKLDVSMGDDCQVDLVKFTATKEIINLNLSSPKPSSAMPGTSRQQRQVKVETQTKSSSPDLNLETKFKVKCGHQRCGYVASSSQSTAQVFQSSAQISLKLANLFTISVKIILVESNLIFTGCNCCNAALEGREASRRYESIPFAQELKNKNC